ncbi:TonB-dependent receptor [Niabella terrae]
MKSLFCLFSFLSVFYFSAQAQTKPITGTVTDENDAPLAGVSVGLENGTAATQTDAAGTYHIDVPSSGRIVLVFSYVGFETVQMPVSGNTASLKMKRVVTNAGDEVVVIGYQTVRRKDLTGAVSSVSGKDVAAVPVANAAQALQGKLPGVNVTTQDGRPDASVSIRVRGGGSISQSNEPLYIVDGFPVSSISDIPPAQIASVDVLKDASSTAIYGARGANGVVIVTTKNGRSGAVTVNYDGYLQSNQPTKYVETMNAYDYIAYNWAYAKAISNGYASAWEKLWAIGGAAADFSNAEGIDHYRNVAAKNYAREAYSASMSQSHNLSLMAGNNKTRLLVALNYVDNDGMKINSWFKRYNASIKLDQKIGEKLDLSIDTRYTHIDEMGNEGTSSGRGSILSSAYQFRPIATADVLGELDDTKNTQLGLYDYVLQDMFNPVARMRDYSPASVNRSLRVNTGLTWRIVKGLTARSELGLNTYWNRGESWSGAIYNNYIDQEGNKTFSGNASISTAEGWNLRWANTLAYRFQNLGQAHQLDLLLGQEVMNSGSKSINIWGNKYPKDFDADRAFAMMDQYFTGDALINYGYSSNTGTPNRLNSYFGRANYGLLDKYLFTFTFRADGSSRFAPSNRWGYFPAAAFAWRMSDENFLKDVSWINNLKMRLSYGTVGNDGISANLWRMNWTSDGFTGYSVNEIQQMAYSPNSTLANPNLKWETTITRNLGLDYSLLDNRLFGSIDVYKNSTKDLLMLTSISAISGFSATYDNVGSTSNRGIEISVGAGIVRKTDFNLNASFNFNFNKGRVDELAPGVNGLYKTNWGSTMTQPNTGDYILEVGKPVGQVRGYTYDGWYTTEDFDYANGVYTLKSGVADIASGIIGTVYGTTANKPGGQVAYPGVVKFKDLDGNGVIDEGDVSVIGDMNPKYTGGLNLNGNYKGLDFALNFNWSVGNKIYNAEYLAAFYGSKEDGLFRNRLNYLSGAYRIFDIQDGNLVSVTDPAALNALNAGATTFLPYHENPVVSTLGIQDGSFLRLNTVTLGYSFPERWISRAGFKSVRLYASVYNALLFTKYKGLDPEVSTNLSQGGAQYPTPGLDWGAYPRARSFTLGLNLQL